MVLKKRNEDDNDSLLFFAKQAAERLKNGEELSGKDGVLAPLIKQIIEASLEGELNSHIDEGRMEGKSNRKTGRTNKTVKSEYGPINLEVGRDRDSSFNPQLISKRQTSLGKGLDNKILSMYSRGMTYSDIQSHLIDLYGLDVSKGKLSSITDQVLPHLEEWRSRPLQKVYPIVWMDALHYKVRHNKEIESRAVYCVLGIDSKGRKELLGLYVSNNEGAKFWLGVLTDLQNRGVEDILIACIDNLTGFSSAIESIFPTTEVQLCIVHQIRNSLKYVTSEDQRPFLNDLKLVYKAKSKESAEFHLDKLEKKWGSKYPVVIRSWRTHWDLLSNYFKFSAQIRRMIYTTNTVEGFNRQLRKPTKSKSVMPNDQALLKLLYLVSQNVIAKWTSPLPKWALIAQQLFIHFGECQ